MSVRHDKFQKGNQVTWFDEEWAKIADVEKRFGKGPFTIKEVIDQHSSNWQGMGHTQHVILEDTPKTKNCNKYERIISGAFFKLVTSTTNVNLEGN